MFRVFAHRRAPARTPTAASNASAPAATSWTTAERSASTGSSSHLKLTSAVADGEVELARVFVPASFMRFASF
jgi:hypothetical protein